MQITEKNFLAELTQKKWRPSYLFYGEEQFKAERFIEKIKITILGNESNAFNQDIFYGDRFSIDEFLAAAESLSLWQGNKLILVKNCEKIAAKHWDIIKKILEQPTDTICIVFTAHAIDLRKKHFQWLNKEAKHVANIACAPLKSTETSFWIRTLAKEQQKEITPEAIQILQDWVGTSLYLLAQAITKAALYSGEQAIITADHIQAMLVRTRLESIYSFTDSVFSTNRTAALKNLSLLLSQGEEPLAILGLLTRNYRWMLEALSLAAEGKAPANEMQNRLFPAAKRLGSRAILRALQEIRTVDKKLKSTSEPAEFMMELLTLNLVNLKAN